MVFFKLKIGAAVWFVAGLLGVGVGVAGKLVATELNPQAAEGLTPLTIKEVEGDPEEGGSRAQEKRDDGNKDSVRLQGTWTATAAIGNGQPVPKELLPNIKVVFAGEKMTFSPPEGGDRPVLEFKFKVDASKTPKAITLTRLVDGIAQKSGPGIYALDGDTLKLCLSIRSGTEPPTEFTAPEKSGLIMLTLKKSKG